MTARILTAYRIGDGQFPLFDGRGAALMGGRWNGAGRYVIYGSLSQGCAMLESLARASIGKLPESFKMITIQIPEALIEYADVSAINDWDHPNNVASQALGDEWYDSKRTAVLAIPSVIAKHDLNIAINVTHPDFHKIKHTGPESIAWDDRLINVINPRNEQNELVLLKQKPTGVTVKKMKTGKLPSGLTRNKKG